MEKIGKFVISLDCELIWGVHHYGGIKRYPYLQSYESSYNFLIDLFSTYKINATFAFVGSIALNKKEFRDDINNSLGNYYKKWLNEIEDKSAKRPELWFNRDIIQKILDSDQNHEIASHSFSHPNFINEQFTKKMAINEFTLSNKILKKIMNEDIKSYIYPENGIGHLDIFKDSKYEIYRGKNKSWYENLPLNRIFHFIDQSLPITPPSVKLSSDIYGNKYLPGSLMLFAYDGIRKIIPDNIRFLKIKKGIDKAIEKKQVFHLWFHPWNIGSSVRMRNLFEKVIKYVEKKSSENLLEVATMSQIIEHN